MKLKSGVCLFVLFLSAFSPQARCAKDGMEVKQVERREAPSTKVIVDTAELLRSYFIALYTLLPICIFECCVCIPIGLGLVLGICATVPGCRIYKSLSRKVREEYILEQEAQMVPPNMIPSTTVYPGNMPAELPPYEQFAQD